MNKLNKVGLEAEFFLHNHKKETVKNRLPKGSLFYLHKPR